MRVTKEPSERRKEIINTGKKLFMENGFDETKMSDISKEMDVSKGLIYHYFKSKTEILYSIIDESAKKTQKEINNILNIPDKNAVQKLNMLFELKLNSDGFNKIISNITSDEAIIEYCSNKINASAESILIELVKQGNSDGSWDCKYPEKTAMFLLYGVSGFVNEKLDSNIKEEKQHVLMDIVLRVLN